MLFDIDNIIGYLSVSQPEKVARIKTKEEREKAKKKKSKINKLDIEINGHKPYLYIKKYSEQFNQIYLPNE